MLFNDEVYGVNDGIYELEGRERQEEEEGDGSLREESLSDVDPSFVMNDDDTISVEIHMETNARGDVVLNNASFQSSEGASVNPFDSRLSEEHAPAIDGDLSAKQSRKRNVMNEHRIVKGDQDVYGDNGALERGFEMANSVEPSASFASNDGEEEVTQFFPLARATLVLGAYDVRPQGRDEQGDDDSLSVTYTRKGRCRAG